MERAISLAIAGEVDAICTAPLNKEGRCTRPVVVTPGTLNLLAALTGTPEVSMMLTAPGLRVIHCTTHIGLADAIERIDPPLVERTIRRGHDALVRSRSTIRGSRSVPSTLTPERAASLAAARKPARLCRRSPPLVPRVSASRAAAGGYGVLPGGAGRLRSRGRDVPRPGALPGEGVQARRRRQHHGRIARDPHVSRSWDSVRHYRHRLPPTSAASIAAIGAAAELAGSRRE